MSARVSTVFNNAIEPVLEYSNPNMFYPSMIMFMAGLVGIFIGIIGFAAAKKGSILKAASFIVLGLAVFSSVMGIVFSPGIYGTKNPEKDKQVTALQEWVLNDYMINLDEEQTTKLYDNYFLNIDNKDEDSLGIRFVSVKDAYGDDKEVALINNGNDKLSLVTYTDLIKVGS